MKRWILLTLLALACFVLGVAATLGWMIAGDTPHRPGSGAPAVTAIQPSDAPAPLSIAARDGAPLKYRLYAGDPAKIVVLVHGSTGSSLDMDAVARALQAAGATVYSISLRGHGGSGTRPGDVSYVGQLEDDLADLAKALDIERPRVKRTLIGFSAGGGFALKVASGPQWRLFDNYIAVAPYFVLDPASREARNNGWVAVATLRVRTIRLLAALGLKDLEQLVVASYAVSPTPDELHTPDYTYRLLMSLRLDRDWRAALMRIQAPTRVIVGAGDALVKINQTIGFEMLNPRVELRVLPALEHLDMVTTPAALAEIVAVWRALNAP